MGCRPQERKLFQAMMKENPDYWLSPNGEALRGFINQYVDIAEGKASDAEVDKAFALAEEMTEQARKRNQREHGSRRGEVIYHKMSGTPGCDVQKLMRLLTEENRCNARWCPNEDKMEYVTSQWKEIKENSCHAPDTEEKKKLCDGMGFHPEKVAEIREQMVKKEVCSRIGCSTDEINDFEAAVDATAEECFGDTWNEDTEMEDLELLFHYKVHRDLMMLSAQMGYAPTRKEKILLIDKFVQIAHHSGGIWEFARGGKSHSSEGFYDVLDCLAGIDREKYEPE